MDEKYKFGEEYDMDDAGEDAARVESDIFGELRGRDGRVVARPVDIFEIWPDVKQPRRAIPALVRGEWDGDPDEVAAVLSEWRREAASRRGRGFDMPELLKGHSDGEENEAAGDPIIDEYVELVSLAASIFRDGLTNPITLAKHNGVYVIETGERRWLAYHVLYTYIHADKYKKIAAREVERADVWRQAAENGARRPLNAIGMARQLALLIMDMYAPQPGTSFLEYGKIVLPGECDRRFYAQVANGNVYRVPRGLGQRILDVTGLKSKHQISQYRNLLGLPNEIWTQSDVENWPEHRIRDHIESLRTPPTSQKGMSTMVNLSPDSGGGINRLAGTAEGEKPLTPGPSPTGGEEGTEEKFEKVRTGDEGDFEEQWDEEIMLREQSPFRREGEKTEEPPRHEGYQEEIEETAFYEPDGEALESIETIIKGYAHAQWFLETLLGLDRKLHDPLQLVGIYNSLAALSPESVRRTMEKPGSLAAYYEVLDGYHLFVMNYVTERLAEMNEFFEALYNAGNEMQDKYGEDGG